MEKLDRLGWVDGISFISYGVRVGIRVNKTGLLPALKKRLPPGSKPMLSSEVDFMYSMRVGGQTEQRGRRDFHLLYSGSELLTRTMELDEVYESLEGSVELLVAASSRQRVFVHAGVVGWAGKAIVLPGRSFTGKTTLVAELLRAGATYYSDEYAGFDGDGYVHSYAKALTLRSDRGNIAQRRTPTDLGSRSGVEPLRVGLIVVTEHSPSARWRPRTISPGEALLALLENTVPARMSPDVVLPTLREVVSQAVALKSRRGEAESIVDYLLSRVGSHPQVARQA